MASYQESGVNIDAGTQAVDLMKAAVRSTYGPEVLQGLGAFGGLFDVSALKDMASPTLVASTDGVGTKTKIATALGQYNTIGYDIVHHCVNDILVQGAKPLFFMDYVAASRLDPVMIAAVVGGCAAACREMGCTLLGGETAEMPDVYAPNEFDLVGSIVGVVDRQAIIDGSQISVGDRVIGLSSDGLHTNGFSLARQVFQAHDLSEMIPELGQPLGEALLIPHRLYLSDIEALQLKEIEIKGLAHITGGGLIDNPPRILPDGIAVTLERESWPIPTIFQIIQQLGRVDEAEMMRAFNMGLGMLMVVSESQVDDALAILGESGWLVGEVVPHDGTSKVQIV